ncbi:MAG: DNA alkylation repair protein [Clostridia bacterium]|nr:DNA alkylation repair protein [Clostridia bacterium]
MENFICDFWDEKQYRRMQKHLNKLAEDGYRQFSVALIPGCTQMLGVRIPKLRALGKEISQGNWREFLKVCRDDSFEEKVLKGVVIGCAPVHPKELEELINGYLPWVDNWAICDYFCSGLKQMKRMKEEVLKFVLGCLSEENPWTRRVGLVLLRGYYVEARYIDDIFLWAERSKSPHYYVQMAHAWLLCECYTKFPQKTYDYFEKCALDTEVLTKAVQKINDSFRVSDEWKKKADKFRRKK